MPDEQIRVDIEARDRASDVIDDVADAAAKLEKTDVEIPVGADTDAAERALSDVDDAARELARADVEIPVTADTDQAVRGIEDIDQAARALSDADREIVLKAKADDAKAGLKDIQGELDKLQNKAGETADKLDDVDRGGGGRGGPRGQAIADLTGPLGDVSGQASDLAGVFDGLGDTLGGLGGRFGVSADAIENALGGISFVAAGAVAAWGLWRQKQEEAKRKLEETADAQRELNQLLADAKFEDAATKLTENYAEAYDAAEKLGVSVGELTAYLAGFSDDLPTVTKRFAELGDAQGQGGETAATLIARYEQMVRPITDAKRGIDDANASIRDQDARTREATSALQENAGQAERTAAKQNELKEAADRTNDAFDRMSDAVNLEAEFHRFNESIDTMQNKVATGTALASSDIDGLKRDIIDLARDAAANPAEVKSTLDAIDRGDLDQVRRDAEGYYRNNPVAVRTVLTNPNYGRDTDPLPVTGPRSVNPFAVPTVGTVVMTLPSGWRGDPLAAVHGATRRHGRLYRGT